MVRKLYLLSGLLIVLGGMVSAAESAELPQLTLKTQLSLQAGRLRDGMHVGTGTLISHDSHTGFRVWSEQAAGETQSVRFVLTGKQNSEHRLRIKLVPEPPAQEGTLDELPGLILYSGDEQVSFSIVLDGNQTVKPDNYVLKLNGAVLLRK